VLIVDKRLIKDVKKLRTHPVGDKVDEVRQQRRYFTGCLYVVQCTLTQTA